MKRILFTGYAPIHFVCFLPVYKRLAADPGVEIFLSGGFKHGKGDDVTFIQEGFYDPFPVDKERVLPIEQIKEEDFDVLVSSHLSDTLFPRSAKKTVQIFHGVSFKNLAVREKALRYDYLCLPGEYHARLYRENGFIREESSKCILTGVAKVDPLAGGELDRSSTLKAIGLDPSLPTLLFAPTGEHHNALDTMGVEVIEAISKEGKWNLMIKPHDHPKKQIDWFTELARFEDSKKVRLVKDKDIIPYLHAADLLITDASSVAVEYTIMDRPIIFLHVPKLFKKLKKRAPALDLDTYGRKIGVIVNEPEEVPGQIAESLAHPEREEEIRQRMARDIFYSPGNAVENVTNVILHAAGITDSLPDGLKVILP